jgi:PPOX class probable FMN-dependent enzyme
MEKISTAQALRQLIGTPNSLVPHKIHPQLNARAIAFIARSPLLMLSTVDEQGQPSVSPKGDPPGFVHVADNKTLLIPERKGNKLIFTLTNILLNPCVGLIFLVPGTSETLRVQGKAELLDDAELCEKFTARGRDALLVIQVHITQCYFHCAKAFLRGEVWDPATWRQKMTISFGEEIAESGGLRSDQVGEFDQAVSGRYKSDL